ncbi:S8 family serine peptidase [Alloiococcus sp. CFN-8]|uniref:S8 family serine peptidase n=1 Tax=Alloiococcus sp. CFN-8 TaxID=3416081 RepID=UPI003CE8C11B
MIWFKNKLEGNLAYSLKKEYYKKYRVLIYCTKFINNIEKKITSYRGTVLYTLKHCSIICAIMPASSIIQLIEFPEVKWVARDTYCFLCGKDVHGANKIRFPERFKLTGRNISIGVIDSGVYPHGDLITPFNRIKGFVDLVGEYRYPYDDYGHGTYVCGIIGGNGSLSKGIYKGLAPEANFYCYKAFNSLGKAYSSAVLFALESLIDTSKEHNIRVLCLPFELYNSDFLILEVFQKLFTIAAEKDLITIVPSGSNPNKEGTIEGIAALAECITVGGLDTTQGIKSYCNSSCGPVNRGSKPDIAAAAVDICSLNTNKNYISEKKGMKLYPSSLSEPYTTFTGTSGACAYITGLCALILQERPELKYKDIKALLKVASNSCDLPRYQQGEGMVDIKKLFKEI